MKAGIVRCATGSKTFDSYINMLLPPYLNLTMGQPLWSVVLAQRTRDDLRQEEAMNDTDDDYSDMPDLTPISDEEEEIAPVAIVEEDTPFNTSQIMAFRDVVLARYNAYESDDIAFIISPPTNPTETPTTPTSLPSAISSISSTIVIVFSERLDHVGPEAAFIDLVDDCDDVGMEDVLSVRWDDSLQRVLRVSLTSREVSDRFMDHLNGIRGMDWDICYYRIIN